MDQISKTYGFVASKLKSENFIKEVLSVEKDFGFDWDTKDGV